MISPMLHKVTGAGHSLYVGGGVGGGVRSWGCGELGGVVVSEFSVAWGKRGEGEDGREFSFLTA